MVEFENHFSVRVIEIFFPEGLVIENKAHLLDLKSKWTANLKSWHSPYTCLIDMRRVKISAEMLPEFERLLQFFQNFFMRKMIGFCDDPALVPPVSFEVIQGYEAAVQKTGLSRGAGLNRNLDDLRSRIQIDNDFNGHVMEIQFLAETHLATKDDIEILKSKLKNILRQWHSPYSIMVNCVNCTFSLEAKEAFVKLESFLKAFFCKSIIGFAPRGEKSSYPFQTFRSRHLAAASLKQSELQSGAVANCQTRGQKPS
jgi:hypothetical protein